MCKNCVNVKIFMKIDYDDETFDLDGLKRRTRVQERWDARQQRKKLNNAITPSDRSKGRKI